MAVGEGSNGGQASSATGSPARLVLVIGAVLFVLAAWPLAFVAAPPYQDLPNHLATATVIAHLDLYPELVFNGFAKTNSALFAWLAVVGPAVGVVAAGRIFALLVLAATALAFPLVVLALTGSRRRTIASSLFAWPMVHNWFVSTGMLDFALAVPLALGLLVLLERRRRAPSPGAAGAAGIAALAIATWYAHVFPLLVVAMLVAVHAAARAGLGDLRARAREAWKLGAPLLPALALVVVSVVEHLRDTSGAMTAHTHHTKMLAAWELVYNLWAEWSWGFTKRSITSIVPFVILLVVGVVRRRDAPTFFSPAAMLLLAALYTFTPSVMTNWYHVNSRFTPFLMCGLLLRVPERLPRPLVALLGGSALAYSVGNGVDFFRLERTREAFVAGIPAVPEGARLLPLIFEYKGGSENTRALLHAWGYYVVAKHTSAPLLFAHSRSFPVIYASPPPDRFNHLVLEGFATSLARPASICDSMAPVSIDDCDAEFRARWAEFWRAATPRFDTVLLWAAPPEARAEVPRDYEVVFERGELVILRRREVALSPVQRSRSKERGGA